MQETQTFPFQDPLSKAPYNPDGTNSSNPVISAGTQAVSGVTYNLQTLTSSTSITFNKQPYTVYSAVPQNMTIDNAYKNSSQYYDPASLTNIDFTIPSTINGGNPTAVAATPTTSPYTHEMVYLTTPPTDPNSLYFIPNLPNSTGSHNGLTANIYFVGDSYIGKPGFLPDPGGQPHLTPYGWAADPRDVNKSYQINHLNSTGGGSTGATTVIAQNPVNYWKHTIKGFDGSVTNIATQIMQGVQTDANYPFPPGTPSKYLNWLVTYNQATKTYTMNGVYFHVQPQPGFQRNLLRYYTAWGAADIYNQSSDLFVRADGTIELPAVKNASGTWQYAPIVAQTWDGSQRFTLLNQTTSQVPSTYDDYPGYEYYLPGNVYLPGKAGVVTAYNNYLVWDNNGKLDYRQTDLWLGFKGDSVSDVSLWDYATVGGVITEPGGQGNKPYMFGAGNNAQGQYLLRLQASNSFCVARLLKTDLQGKLYDASFYANSNDGKGYVKAATISYQWQPWTLSGTTQATWIASPDSYGAGVPKLTYANTLGGQVAITADQSSWDASARTLPWLSVKTVDPSKLSQYGNTLNNPIWGNYIIAGTATNATTQFLLVLNPSAYYTPGTGDWGTATNWSSGTVPDDNYNVYLPQSGTVTYNNTAATAPSLSMLQVDGTTLQINSAGTPGALKAEMAIVGGANTGTLVQTNGTVTLTDKLYLGYETASNGTYTLQGGTFTAANALVGVYGTGTFTQSNGTATISDTLTLAANSGSTATYNLSGGSHSVGTVNLNDGGTFNHTGGTLTFTTFNQSGGTATFTGVDLSLGPSQTYNFSGGSHTAGTINLNTGGTFNQTGGTLTFTTFNQNGGAATFTGVPLSIGTSQAYNLSGGSFSAGTINLDTGGTFNQTGGTLNYSTFNCGGGGFTGDLINNGLLTGTGPITGNFTNSGTVNPGNSPGTLSVVGSFTQTASGTYRAEVASDSSYDKIVVTGAPGTATLAGAIAPTLYNGFKPRGNQVFPGVLTATGGITGTFTTIANQQFSPTLFWQASYNPNSVDLWVQRNYTNSGLSLNSNQQAVGTMLNGLAGVTTGDLDTVLNAVDYLPDSASVRDAFKQISPEKAGALTNLGFVAATSQMRNLATRTTNLRFVQGQSYEGSSLTSGGLSCNYSKLDGLMLAYNGATISNLFSTRKEFQAPDSRWGLFVDGGAAFGSQNSSVNQTGYNFTLGGFTLGADYRLRNNLVVGLATGYSNTSAAFYGSGGSVNAHTIPFNAYAAYFPGSLYAYGSVGYALNLFDLKRGINFGGLARSAASSTTGNQFNLYGETGYDLKLSRFILTPSATLAYSALWVNGFTEQDAGALNLKVGAQSANSLQTGLGGRVTLPLRVGSVKVVPQGYAFYQHEFSNGSRGLNASLSQGSSTFNFQTDAAKRNYALVGASVTVGLKKNLYAQVNYSAEVGRSNSTVHYVNAGLRFEF